MTANTAQLLATKILLPHCGPSLIDRPRLVGQLEQIQSKQVSLIRAGPGFGKTTLAVAWAEQLQQAGKLVAWVAFDDEDDEPHRFLFYVSHALRRTTDSVGETAIGLISDTSLVSPKTIVSSWINDLVELDDELYLFFDDYHHITDPEIGGSVSFLLRYAPTQFHLVVTANGDPVLPLERLRSHNHLFEIDSETLRFDVDETYRFLRQENIHGLDVPGARHLQAKTEGWPAVLRIVAASLSQSGQNFAGYAEGLSGALRPIGGYLAEMLDTLPHDLVQFMLRIAILDRFSAPLCHAVTGSPSSLHFLKTLEAHQILLAPLDQEGHWHRFHGLLAGHLRQRLETELGNEARKLHRRAYRWFAAQELWTEAVQHAIAAGDADSAISWIETCAMALVTKGDLLTLLGWQRLFPAELARSRTCILATAWGLTLTMRFDDASELLSQIEWQAGDGEGAERVKLSCELDALRSLAAALQDDSLGALPIAEAGMNRATEPWTANVSSNIALFAYWKAGDLRRFYAVPWISARGDEDRRIVFAAIYRRCLQGLVEFEQLRIGAAERCYLEAMDLAERDAGPNTAAAALPASLLGRIRYEQGRFDEAEAIIVDHSAMIDATGMLDAVLSAYFVLIEVAARRRDLERAHALLEQLETLGHARKWGRIVAAALATRLRLHLAEGRITEAGACLNRLERLAADYPAPTRCAWSEIHDQALLARSLMETAQNRLAAAIATLRALRQAATNEYFALRVACHLAVALLAADEAGEADRVFAEIVAMAAPADICMTIIGENAETGALLLRFQENARRSGLSGELPCYAGRLIAVWRRLHHPGEKAPPDAEIVESLSPRERNILDRVSQGRSNKEIARQLGIAPETVKSHIKNIFIKLSVERRAQAVSRAYSLGLVGT